MKRSIVCGVMLLALFAGCSEQSTQPAGCLPGSPASCLDPTLFCGAAGSCLGCAPGTTNCDGNNANACECNGSCSGSVCTPGTVPAGCDATFTNSCNNVSQYCLGAPGQCTPCAPGTANCDGDNTNACECAGSCNGVSCIAGTPPPVGMVSDACPATTTAVTSSTSFNGNTSQQLPGDTSTCAGFSQVVKIQLAQRSKLTFSCTTTNSPGRVSLRTQCMVDHGCSPTTTSYIRDIDPGTYNFVVATATPSPWQCTVTYGAPDPP